MGKGEHDEGKPYDYSPNVDKEKMGVLGRKWYESQVCQNQSQIMPVTKVLQSLTV